MTAEHRHKLDDFVLPAESVELHNGYEMAACIDADGVMSVWLVSDDAAADRQPVAPPPRHEDAGKLPAAMLVAIHGQLPRCGHPTSTTGDPCQQAVHLPGARCRWHQRAAS
jgi:hypothetical protein